MISLRELDGIRKAIGKLDRDFMKTAEQVILRVGLGDKAALISALLAMEPSASLATYLAAQLAASVYNAWRLADVGETVATVAQPTLKSGKWAAMVNTAAKADTVEKVLGIVAGRIGYETRNAYAQTLFANGRRDSRKPKYARVPTGAETCDFCLMLGSRGFVYTSGSLGESPHNHANCDCVYACSWKQTPEVDGYDPDEVYDRWQQAVDDEAKARAERNGTSVDDEKAAIMRRYDDIADKSRKVDVKVTPGEYARQNGLDVEYFVSKKGKEMLRVGERTYPASYENEKCISTGLGYEEKPVKIVYIDLEEI